MTGCLRCRPKGGGSKLRTENGFGFAFAPFPFSRARFSERPGAGKGARFLRGGGKSFPGLKRVCGADPWRRGPFWNMDVKGKGASAVFIAAPPRRACDAFCAWIRLSARCGKRCAPGHTPTNSCRCRLVRLVEDSDAGGPTHCWPRCASACDPTPVGAGNRRPRLCRVPSGEPLADDVPKHGSLSRATADRPAEPSVPQS